MDSNTTEKCYNNESIVSAVSKDQNPQTRHLHSSLQTPLLSTCHFLFRGFVRSERSENATTNYLYMRWGRCIVMTIHAYASHKPGGKLEAFEYDPGSLKSDEIEIDVEYCGICHSDFHMLKNEWGLTQYPFVPGHEVVGKVSAIGSMVKHLEIGQYVGLGWRARSCLICDQCLSGHHNRCLKGEDVIVGRHGGYADKVRCQALWAFPLPDNLDTRNCWPFVLWWNHCF